ALRRAAVRVSLFIAPDPVQIEAAREVGADAVELHTGVYCDAASPAETEHELARLRAGASLASRAGLQVNAGHGLRIDNVAAVARIPEIVELNIGHSIVARAVLVGMEAAVREMREALDRVRGGP
ncbi:MAG: pyridoxine 5'-phosphate synthase, partial [Candidatus Binatia bacterium]